MHTKPLTSFFAIPNSIQQLEQLYLRRLRMSHLAIVAAFLGLWLLVAWWPVKSIEHGIVLQSPQKITDFTLMTSNGEPASLSDFRGKYVLLNFGYTYCPDVCPLTLAHLAQATERLGAKASQTQVIFVSVDPERDSTTQLAAYLDAFHPSFIGMTGSVEEIETVATRFGIFFQKQPSASSASYLVDHTATVVVVDPEGYMRILFPYGVSGGEMATDLSTLIR